MHSVGSRVLPFAVKVVVLSLEKPSVGLLFTRIPPLRREPKSRKAQPSVSSSFEKGITCTALLLNSCKRTFFLLLWRRLKRAIPWEAFIIPNDEFANRAETQSTDKVLVPRFKFFLPGGPFPPSLCLPGQVVNLLILIVPSVVPEKRDSIEQPRQRCCDRTGVFRRRDS